MANGKVTAKVKDDTKVYGDEYTGYDIEITSVTVSVDNKTYALNGTFTVGMEYTVEITYDNATQDISNKTLTINPSEREWKNPFADVTKGDWFFDNVRYAKKTDL